MRSDRGSFQTEQNYYELNYKNILSRIKRKLNKNLGAILKPTRIKLLKRKTSYNHKRNKRTKKLVIIRVE